MASISRVLREERRRLRLTQAELAVRLGVSQATVSRWEKDLQTPDFESMMKLSDLMGFDPVKLSVSMERPEHSFNARIMWAKDVRVVGGLKTDKWVESVEWEESDQFDIQIPPMKGWDDFDIEGFVVQDDSAEPYFLRESIVFCAKVDLSKYALVDDDIVVVVREDDRGLFEVTLKEVYVTASDNKILLMSVGERPEFQQSFQLVKSVTPNSGLWMPQVTESTIRGLVVSSYRAEMAGLRRSDLSKNE